MKIIAVTGWGQEEDRQKTKDAGFNSHLVKPVEPAALLELLAELTTSTQECWPRRYDRRIQRDFASKQSRRSLQGCQLLSLETGEPQAVASAFTRRMKKAKEAGSLRYKNDNLSKWSLGNPARFAAEREEDFGKKNAER